MPSLAGVALRGITRAKRRTLVIMAAVIGGSAALIFMMGMNAGLSRMTIANSVGLMLGSVQVDALDESWTVPVEPALSAVERISGVAGAAPRLEIPALASRDGGAMHGTLLLGIDASREAAAGQFATRIVTGALPETQDGEGVALGSVLAARLGLSVGDAFAVSWLDAHDQVRHGRLTVKGILRTGAEELDGRLGLIPLATAQQWLGFEGPPRMGRLIVRSAGDQDERALAASIASAVGGEYRVRTWWEVSPYVRGMVGLQRGAINVVLAVIYLVIGSGVAAVQLMGILQRTREFGVLASIGFTPQRIVTLIACESLFTGAVAVAAGIALGCLLVELVSRSGGVDVRLAAGGANLEAIIGLDSHLKPVLSGRAVAFAGGLIAPVFVLGGVIPALRAARMTPLEALKR